MKLTAIAAMLALAMTPALADDDDDVDGFGAAGILSGSNKENLPPIFLSAGEPLSDAPWVLKSGTYYEFEIQGDGSQE
ncbi:MAG: hypothetical protein AAFY14_07455, partial [Pseudomonadota bacterium]